MKEPDNINLLQENRCNHAVGNFTQLRVKLITIHGNKMAAYYEGHNRVPIGSPKVMS